MKKRRVFFLSLAALFAIGAVSLYALSGINFGTETLRSVLEKSFGPESPCVLSVGEIKGNPISGYTIYNLALSTPVSPIYEAEMVFARPSLSSLIARRPVIHKLRIESFTIFVDTLSGVSMNTKEGNKLQNLPLLEVEMEKGRVTGSPIGSVSLEKGRLHLERNQFEATIQSKLNDLLIEIETTGKYGEDGISVQNLTAKTEDSLLRLSGRLTHEIGLAGKIESIYLADIQKALPSSEKGQEVSLSGQGASSLIIRGRWPNLVAEGGLYAEKANLAGFDLSQTLCRWSWDGKNISFLDIKGEAFQSPITGSIILAQNNFVHFDLSGKDVVPSKWYGVFPWLKFAQGPLETLHLDLAMQGGNKNGTVTFSSPATAMSGIPLENVSGTVAFNPDNTLTVKTHGEWHKARVVGEGTVSLGKDPMLDLALSTSRLALKNIRSTKAPLRSLALEGDVAGTIKLLGPSSSFFITGQFGSERIRLGGNLLEKLSIAFEQKENVTTVSSFSAFLGKTPIQGKGHLTNLFSEEETYVNFEGRGEKLQPSFLEQVFPAIKTLKMRGPVSLEWKLTGPAQNAALDINIQGTSNSIFDTVPLEQFLLSGRYEKGQLALTKINARIMDGILSCAGVFNMQKDTPFLQLEGNVEKIHLSRLAEISPNWPSLKGQVSSSFSLSGPLNSPGITATLDGEKISLMGLLLDRTTMEFAGSLRDLSIEKAEIALGDSLLTGSGLLSFEKGLDINITIPPTHIQKIISQWYPNTPVDGVVSGEIAFSGPFSNPVMDVKGTLPTLRIGGLALNDVALMAKPEKNGVIQFSLDSIYKKFNLSLTGEGSPSSDGWLFSLSSGPEGLPLEKLTANGNGQQHFFGTLQLLCEGKITSKGISGKGILTSPKVKFYGFTLSNLDLPFETTAEGRVVIADGKAKAYDGKGAISGSFDPHKFRWEGFLNFENMDLEKASSDWLPPQGKITGTGTLNLNVSGTMGQLKLIFGNGSLFAKEGAVSGFPLVTKISSNDEIRYQTILANFNLDGRSVYLLPGSRVAAYPEDTTYRYFTASGAVGLGNQPINLKCVGDINLKALNAFLGAISGLMSVGDNITDPLLLQRFLSGLVGGYSSIRDFREASFTLSGTWNNIKMYDLKVSQPAYSTSISSPSPLDEKRTEDEDEIKIKLSFPTGEGKDSSLTPGEQVKKQIMENLLKQIIKPGEEDTTITYPERENGTTSPNGQ